MFDNYFTAPAVLYYSSLVVYNVHGCMDIYKDTKKADKVVEKVAKVDDLIILVSLDWCNLVSLEIPICTLQSFQLYLGKGNKSIKGEFFGPTNNKGSQNKKRVKKNF